MAATLAQRIQEKLHREIPMSGPDHLNFRLQELSETRTQSELPLKGNTNHLGTQFGGSLFCAGALTCYSTLLGILDRSGISTNSIVIIESSIRYLSPGDGDVRFEVSVEAADARRLVTEVKGRGYGKITFQCRAYRGDRCLLEVSARYKVSTT